MRRLRIWRATTCTFIVAALLGLAAAATAQETTGTITGTATDQTGAVLPGVTVTVKHVQTGRSQDFVTNASGNYIAPLLQPGEYEVTFTLSGFQTATVKNIQLHVNDRLDVSNKLGVAGATETVNVSAAQQFVQPTPQVQSLMGPTQVQELPLNNRNFVQLATLVPGVSSDLTDEVGVGLTSTVSLSINGGRRNSINFLVDGVQNVDVGSNITLLSTPTLESIQEFKIITSSYAAEWPRSGGGVVNIVTKGGTQKFSGTAYNFFRNDKLNANSFIRNRSTTASDHNPPRLRYNNPGYTIGGPLLPSRQKAFFFWSEEWRRISRVPASLVASVVNPAWLNDPANENYVAPADRDPAALKLLSLWPSPNQFSANGTAQFNNSVPTINNTRQEVIRVDYDASSRWKVVGRYTHDLSQTVEPGGLFTSILIPNVSATHTDVPGQVAALELRGMFGNMLNELKYQFSSNRIGTTDDPDNVNTRSALGVSIPELFPENNAGRFPSISLTGNPISPITTIQAFNIEYFDNTVTDNVTWTRGNHAFKFGGLAAFEQKNENANNQTQGSFTFGAGGGRTAFQNFLTGNRDGLCGTACTYSEAQIDVTNHLRFNRFEGFAQDTWRFTPRMTLDYGVRYSVYPAMTDKNDLLDTFVPSLYDPAKTPACANATCSAFVPGTGDPLNGIIVAAQNSPYGRSIYPTDKNNIQPRVGLSWDPQGDGKSIVRFGYGVYFDQPLVGIFEQNAFTNPPYVNTVSLQNPSLANPSAGTAAGTTGARTLIATSAPFETPRTQQWNIGYQRQLYSRGSIDVGYVGSHGDHLIQPVDINRPTPAAVVAAGGSLNLAAPFPGYTVSTSNAGAGINMRQTTAYSNYWGILTQFRHEAGRAGTYTVNYTLSRNRATASNDRDSVDIPQNPNDLKAEYADARTDRRHIFNATYILELPFFRDSSSGLLKAALGGWQFAGYTTIQSGPPVSRVVESTNGDRRGMYADQVGDPGAGEQQYPYWINVAAFQPAQDGNYGNSKRAAFRLPGRNQTDLALSKNFYPVGQTRLQFRADFINAFNHTQWLAVSNSCDVSLTTCNTGTFGQITSVRNPREIQLSLKLFW